MSNFKEKYNAFKNEYGEDNFVIIPILFIVSFLQWLSLDLSSHIGWTYDKIEIYSIAGICTMFFINFIFVILFRRTKLAFIVTGFFSLILSVVNNLVYTFHGTPFVISDIHNIETAIDAIKGANIVTFLFRPRYVLFILLFLLQIFLIGILRKKHEFNMKYKIKFFALLFALVFFYYGMFGTSLIPQDTINWSFEYGIDRFGYLACLIRQAALDRKPISYTEGYNEEKTIEVMSNYVRNNSKPKDFKNLPDIILILNESFYDLSQLSSLSGDDYLRNFYSFDNAIYGYTIIPGLKSGTNLTEQELLNSNSMILTSNITPFNTLNYDNANSNIIHLKNLGYSTISMHPMNKKNYNRNNIYPKIGFDRSLFEDDFENIEYWDKRIHAPTDKCLYDNLVKVYNEMGDGPRFIYALANQNHAFFDYVKDENLITNKETKFGKENHEVNEFLSCIKMSDEAFKDLINYYKKSKRGVIICMFGDHAPFIFTNYDLDSKSKEYHLKIQSTPFVIWSNNKNFINKKFESNIYGKTRISTVYLIPTILESAGIPLSNYEQFLINLRNEIPVFSTFGDIYNCSGDCVSFADFQGDKTSDGIELYNKVCEYLDVEYLNLTNPTRVKEFFE